MPWVIGARGLQLVGQDRQELALAAIRLLQAARLLLGAAKQPGVVDGDRRLRRHAHDQALVPFVEYARLASARRTARPSPRRSAR